MTLELFHKDQEAAEAYATRHSGANLPSWWDLHGDALMRGAGRLVLAVVMIAAAYALWRYRIAILGNCLALFRRAWASLAAFGKAITNHADQK